MITPSDEDYRQTKQLKHTGFAPSWPFNEIADWIAVNYRVTVLNAFYDTINVGGKIRPRLTVILETENDAAKFREPGRFGNFLKVDQQRVREKFAAIISTQSSSHFSTEGLIVPFVAFESVAIKEACQKVTNEQRESLKVKLANTDLWQIATCWDSVSFLFYTAEQAMRYEAMGLRETYSEEYTHLIAAYDEFGYVRKNGLSVKFDSKENFEKKYQGSWFFYWR